MPEEGRADIGKLEKAYEITMRLRSQIIGVIYDMKEYGSDYQSLPEKIEYNPQNKKTVTLIIDEPLPGMKELTVAVEEHWRAMIHEAIKKESRTGIPKFQKSNGNS